MKIKILKSAQRDLKRGKKFYSKQGEGLGMYFLDSLISDIESLLVHFGTHFKRKGYYCCNSKRFPYMVYYKLDEKLILVHSILDCRSKPDDNDKKLKRTGK